MKKISIASAAACLLLGLANAHAADMSQDNMKNSGTEMKSDAMQKDSMSKGSMQGMGKSGGTMQKGDAMQKGDTMQKGMQDGAMDKGAMQK